VLLNLALGYAVERVQANHEGLKLSGVYQILVYGDNANLLEVTRPKILQAI